MTNDAGRTLSLHALAPFPHVRPGDDLAGLTLAALDGAGLSLADGDVLVFAQKVVSKAAGRQVALADVAPSARALSLAETVRKDPRLVELVLRESVSVLRARPDVLIVEHRLGFVMANAGIDQSNVEDGEATALLLPEDPDAWCRELRERLPVDVGVIVSDSHGRAWRQGTVGVAIGAAGLPALWDRRGELDLFGRALRVTEVGWADEIAAAASLLMGQAAEGRPVVLVRGLPRPPANGRARDLVRPLARDLFR